MAEPLPALSIQVPQPATPSSGIANINPFQAVEEMARIRQLNNENQKFQLEQWANRGMAEIMSRHAGDEEGGLREILASPFAPYGAGFANTIRQSNQSLAETGKALADTGKINFEANDNVMHSMVKYLGPMYSAIFNNRPEEEIQGLGKTAIQSTLSSVAGMTKGQQQSAVAGMQSIIDGVNANLPADPALARQVRLDRIANLIPGSGMDAAGMDRILHKTTQIKTAQGTFFGTTDAAGNFIPQANPLYPGGLPGFVPEGYAPHIGKPGEALYPGTDAFGRPLPPPGTPVPTPTTPTTHTTPTTGAQEPPVPATQGARAMGATLPAGQSRMAWDGRPLWTDDMMRQNPPVGSMDQSGTQWIWQGGETEQNRINENTNKWVDKEKPRYEMAQSALMQFDAMDASLDRLANTLLQPGSVSPQRYEAIKALNMVTDKFNSTFGTKIGKLADNADIQAYEQFVKEATRAQFQVVSTQFGYQREAGSVVAAAGRAVPNVDATLMGDKLNLEGLRASTHRIIDQYEFQREWARTHRGDLGDSEVRFNNAHPSTRYEQGVLQKFGLTNQGFNSLVDINKAVANHWIEPAAGKAAALQWREQQRTRAENP